MVLTTPVKATASGSPATTPVKATASGSPTATPVKAVVLEKSSGSGSPAQAVATNA